MTAGGGRAWDDANDVTHTRDRQACVDRPDHVLTVQHATLSHPLRLHRNDDVPDSTWLSAQTEENQRGGWTSSVRNKCRRCCASLWPRSPTLWSSPLAFPLLCTAMLIFPHVTFYFLIFFLTFFLCKYTSLLVPVFAQTLPLLRRK